MRLERFIKPGPAHIVRLGHIELSFAELDRVSARVAALLRGRGVLPGERVAVMLVHVAELPGIYFGVLRAGAVVVPLDVAMSAEHVAARLAATECRIVFTWHACLDAAEAGARRAGADYVVVHPASFHALLEDVVLQIEDVERGPQDVAVLLHPSGGSSVVEVTHAELAELVMPLTTEEVPC